MKPMGSPFKFLDAYEKKDKDIFFGREKDIELLYETTFKTNLMLVYGQSGTGKTSLIQCGLANRFRKSDWFDIYIRRRDNIVISLQKEIRKKGVTRIAENATIQEGIQSLYREFLRPVYLIFDQFEELIILGETKEQQEFFETMVHLLKAAGEDGQKAVSIKIIFVMREEYIARLYDFEKVVPGLFNYRFRVEQMPPLKVREVILGTTQAFGIKVDEPEETIKGIIDNNRDLKGNIQLPYLQVYLDRLYKEAEAEAVKPASSPGEKPAVAFTPGLVKGVGQISDVMAAFLDEQTGKVQLSLKEKYPDTPKEFTCQMLNSFATVEGTNLPLDKGHLYSQFPGREKIIDFCLEGLEKARILRLVDNEKTYEIAHDALAWRISDRRSIEEKVLLKLEKLVKDRFAAFKDTRAFLAKEELNYIEPYEKKLKSKLDAEEKNFIAKSRKKVSKRRNLFVFVTANILIILIFAAFSVWKWQVAKEKTKEANANRLALLAEAIVKDDPTIGLRLAEEARRLDNNTTVTETLTRIYLENIFYKSIAKHKIRSVAFSPDGKYILTGSADAAACLWDLHGNLVQEFKGHKDSINSVVFSPDGKYILSGSEDKTARLWDLQGKPVKEFNGHEEPVTSVAFSPDGKYILSGSDDKTARLWDLNGNTEQEFKGHESEVTSVAFSPDGKYILTGSWDKTARLWDLNGNTEQEFKGHESEVTSVAFSPDGKYILTGSWDKTARLWDLQGNKVQEFNGHTKWIYSVTFSPDGNYILTGSGDNTVRLWDLHGNTIQEFKGHKNFVTSVAFSPDPDGKTILTGSWDKTARLWDRKEILVGVFSGHIDAVTSVTFSPDGNYVLTGSVDNTARIWDLQGNFILDLKGHKDIVTSVAFSPDGKTLLTGSWDKTACLWDLQGNMVMEFKGHNIFFTSVAFSPDGKYILTSSHDKTTRLWDLHGKLVQEFKGHNKWVSSVAFSLDGKTILTGSWDKTARLWELDGNRLQEFKGHDSLVTSVAFSPNGQDILTGSQDKTARLFDLQGKMVTEFKGHKDFVTSVAFSPDGQFILTGSRDETARLWDRQGNLIWEFKGHKYPVNAVAFSPDGKYILTGSEDSTARLWRVPHISLKDSLEDFLKKGNLEPLTNEQKKEYEIED